MFPALAPPLLSVSLSSSHSAISLPRPHGPPLLLGDSQPGKWVNAPGSREVDVARGLESHPARLQARDVLGGMGGLLFLISGFGLPLPCWGSGGRQAGMCAPVSRKQLQTWEETGPLLPQQCTRWGGQSGPTLGTWPEGSVWKAPGDAGCFPPWESAWEEVRKDRSFLRRSRHQGPARVPGFGTDPSAQNLALAKVVLTAKCALTLWGAAHHCMFYMRTFSSGEAPHYGKRQACLLHVASQC